MNSEHEEGKIGFTIASVGAGIIVGSIIVGFGITGATVHNVLQLGGLLISCAGIALSRLKKV